MAFAEVVQINGGLAVADLICMADLMHAAGRAALHIVIS